MSTTKLRTIVSALAIVCVLGVALLPIAAANYGEVQQFTHYAPNAFSSANIMDVYWNSIDPENQPGRVCTVFTIQFFWGENYTSILDSTEALAIGTIAFYVGDWMGYDKESAREFYESLVYTIWIDGEPIDLHKTPLRTVTVHDKESGLNFRYWEWRFGAAYKKGELAEEIGLGPHTIRFQVSGTLDDWDSADFGTYWFILV